MTDRPDEEIQAQIDAHLWAIGIGSDARKMRVLMCDGGGPLADAIEERLLAFGAEVFNLEYWEENYEDGTADAAVVVMPCAGYYIDSVGKALKPEGRYLVLVEGVSRPPELVVTDTQVVEGGGGACVRVAGYKPQRQEAAQESAQEAAPNEP